MSALLIGLKSIQTLHPPGCFDSDNYSKKQLIFSEASSLLRVLVQRGYRLHAVMGSR